VADTSLEHVSKQEQLIVFSPQHAIDTRQAFAILHRRRFLILGVSCAVVSVGSLLALTTKPTYQSSMQILVRSHFSQDTGSKFLKTNPETIDYTKLMLSSLIIQRAVDLLRSNYPNITVEEIKGKNNHQKYLAVRKLEEHVSANQFLSQLFQVSFNANDPFKSQRVLQVLEKEYTDYNAEQQKEQLQKALSLFNEQLSKAKNQVIQSEKKLEQFRQKNNLLEPEKQGKILLQSLADTRKQLRVIRAQIQDVKARYNYLHKELASLNQNRLVSSAVEQSNQYQALLSEIRNTEQTLAQERERYTDDSPVVEALLQKHQSLLKILREDFGQSGFTKPVDGTAHNSGFLTMTTSISQFPKQVELHSAEPSKNQTSTNAQLSNSVFNSGDQNISMTQVQMAQVNQKMVEDLIDVQKTESGLTANEKSLVESEQEITSELNKYQNLMVQYKRLLPEAETNHKTLEKLIAAQHSLGLKVAEEGLNLQVLEQPQPGISLGSNRLLFLLGGLVLAPILGVAAALIRELLDDTIHSAEDLHKLTNIRLLGTIPKLPLKLRKNSAFKLPGGWLTSDSRSAKATSNDKFLDIYNFLPSHETLDIACQNIQIVNSAFACKSLALTSALPGEGKSTLALGLALSAAHMNRRVLIIDANLRKPNLHKILEISNDWGLSLLLIDEPSTNFRDYIQPVHPFIDVLTAGPLAEDPVTLLSSSRLRELISVCKQTYDLVLIDTSHILDTVDARLVASVCDGIVMVSRLGLLTQAKLTQATKIFCDSKLNLIGFIANDASR
jgi:capsular exopolysaccharide synthesis family protein